MYKGPRIDNDALLRAGLKLMEQNGKPLSKLPSKGRTMLYGLPNGETVRVRTCNDHILIAVAESPEKGARLNIEGTDWILLVMPETERTPGNVLAYLLPTQEVVQEVRDSHQKWLASNPNTKGENTTWNLWFRPDGPPKASGYAEKWKGYLLSGRASTDDLRDGAAPPTGSAQPVNVRAEVDAARLRIAEAAGVTPDAVRITIDFGM